MWWRGGARYFAPWLTNQILPHGSQYDDSSMIWSHESLLLVFIYIEGRTDAVFTAAAESTAARKPVTILWLFIKDLLNITLCASNKRPIQAVQCCAYISWTCCLVLLIIPPSHLLVCSAYCPSRMYWVHADRKTHRFQYWIQKGSSNWHFFSSFGLWIRISL